MAGPMTTPDLPPTDSGRAQAEAEAQTDAPTETQAAPTGQPTLGQRFRQARSSLIWRTLARQKWWILGATALAVVSGALVFSVVSTTRDLIDLVLVAGEGNLDDYIGRLVWLAVLNFIVGLALRQTIARVSYHIEYELRVHLYQLLQRTDPRSLDSLPQGQLITRAITDLEILQVLILILPGIAWGAVAFVALSGYLLYLQPILGTLAMLALPLNFSLIKRVWSRLQGLSWLNLQRRAEVTTAIDESVRGIRVMKAFGREGDARAEVEHRAKRAYDVGMAWVRVMARYDVLLRGAPILIDALLLFFALRLIVNGDMTIGTYAVFIGLASVFTGLASGFDEIGGGWNFATSGASRIGEVMSLARVDTPFSVSALPPRSDGLRFEQVTAAAAGQVVLRDLDLSAGPGEVVLVTGGGPGARSILVGLAMGTVAPQSGQVTLDGHNLLELGPAAVASAVRVLGEDPFLFARSVRENVDLDAGPGGRRRHDDAAVLAALAAAGADEVVAELDAGLDTVLGDRGMTLSGGQRQRVALARALLDPPRVLVLDDALSAVNPALEVEIIRRIREHAPDMAVLVLARRPSAAPQADRIIDLPEEAELGWDALAAGLGVAAHADPDVPSDPKRARAVATLEDHREDPGVSDSHAEADRRPTIADVLSPFKVPVAIAVVGMALVTSVELARDAATKWFVDAAEAGDLALGTMVVGVLAGLAVAAGASAYLRQLFQGRADRGVMYVLRRRVFARLCRLGVDHYDRELPGQVSSRVVRDLDVVSNFIDQGLALMVSAMFVLVGTMLVLFVWSASVALAVVPWLVALAAFTALQFRIADRALSRARERLGDVVTRMQEDFAGRYVISGFGANQSAEAGFHAAAWELRRAMRWSTTVTNVYDAGAGMIAGLATAALFRRAGQLALAGVLTTGSVLALAGFLRKALTPIEMFAGVLRLYLNARVSFRKLREPYDVAVRPEERPGARTCPPLEGRLRLTGVSFAYPGTTKRVLEAVDMEVGAGETVAVVGATGAGKSSIAKLVARIYDPDEGVVSVDGTDIRDFELRSYRDRLGVVPQDAFLFRGTVASNISYGRPEASREEIEAAAEAVGAAEALLALPDGYDTKVEEEGRNLGASHRQLVALARAWLVGPDVLVLDEATAALEPAQEQAVIDAVKALGRTTIIIAHRLAVAEQADRVVVIDRGRVVEEGAHRQLMRTGGPYAALWGRPGSESRSPTPAGRRRRRAAARA